MIEALVGGRQRSFDAGYQATGKERKLSPWTKSLIKDMVIALPAGRNGYERQAEPGKGGERKQSPWGKPLPKETISAQPAGNSYEGYKEALREEKIRQIKDRLSGLGAEKERPKKGGRERKEKRRLGRKS